MVDMSADGKETAFYSKLWLFHSYVNVAYMNTAHKQAVDMAISSAREKFKRSQVFKAHTEREALYECMVLWLLKKDGHTTQNKLTRIVGCIRSKIAKILKCLNAKNQIERVGGKRGYWEVFEDEKVLEERVAA